jgi:aminomethyltransferase
MHADEARLARDGAALFELSETHGVIKVAGPDASTFLQPITSNDLLRLGVGQGQHNALLNKQSGILAEFRIFRMEEGFQLIAERFQLPVILETLEYYHFAEDVVISDESKAHCLLALQGRRAPGAMQTLTGDTAFAGDYVANRSRSCKINGAPVSALAWSLTGDEGWVLVFDPPTHGQILEALSALKDAYGVIATTAPTREALRIEAGLPLYGPDIDSETRVLDTGLGESIVSFDKGCFPGQEIVARIKSRGEVSRKLMGLIFEKNVAIAPGDTVTERDKQVGTLRSVTESPQFDAPIALAYLAKRIRAGREYAFAINGAAAPARVVELPFYTSASIEAAAGRQCDAGVAAFHAGDFEAARQGFEQALDILPGYADALEGLGLSYERMQNLDEAIRVNARYADLHPDEIMPHTNLSRLYMFKGLKEQAEDELAKATMIKFRTGGTTVSDAEFEQTRKEQLAAEQTRKVAIFEQVLEIDTEDEVANFGMGSARIDEGDFATAIAHLEIVVRNNDTYSAAYELLARALRGAGRTDDTRAALEKGIAVAESNGDLMPLKAMQDAIATMFPDNT